MAIKKDLQISVGMTLTPTEPTWCCVSVNGNELFRGILAGPKLVISQVGIEDPIHIKISVDRQHPQAVIVTSLGINSFDVLPRFQHECEPPTTYIDFTGKWELDIEPSFYPWYHKVCGKGWIIS